MRVVAGGAWLAALIGCGEGGGPQPDAGVADPQGQIAGPDDIADAHALRRQAHAALTAGRLHAPMGDNAVERFLALRAQRPDDVAAAEALVALQPYVLIGAEQALAAADRAEAGRLVALLERMDAQAPALPRLQAALQAMPATTALPEPLPEPGSGSVPSMPAAANGPDQARDDTRSAQEGPDPALPQAPGDTAADAALPVDVAQREVVPPQASEAPSAPWAGPEPATVVPSAEAPADGITASAPASPLRDTAAGGPESVPGPALLIDVAPRYPTAALHRRLEGSVVLAFMIGPDGRVEGARVVSADPAGVFDRAALQAAERWRFEASGRSHPTSRILRFSLAEAEQGG